MRRCHSAVLLACLLTCSGCGSGKSTDDLIRDLNSGQEGERIKAARLLAAHKRDANKVVPALMDALKDKDGDVRWSAAIGLGYFGEEAQAAVPALQAVAHDSDARVREAAGVALSRIDPARFPKSVKQATGRSGL